MSVRSPSRTGAASVLAGEHSGRFSQAASTQHRDAASVAAVGASGAHPNPFTIPADADIFRLQKEQRADRRAAKAAAASLSVRDKSTAASRQQALFMDDAVRSAFHESMRQQQPRAQQDAGSAADASLAAAACAAVPRRVARENVRQLLAKKRETLLVQMSLDTKRAEIRKLQERARQREEALQRSEAMLEEDALRFDAFLKENDELVTTAIRTADVEAKARQDKVLEIKRLNGAVASLRSELNKLSEALEECQRHKEFLDSVTPPEWFAAQAAKQAEQQQQQLAAWQAECDALKQRRDAAAAAKARAEADYTNAATQQEAERAERAIKAATGALKEALRIKDPPAPRFDGAADLAAGGASGSEMFFRRPEQLLQVYADLEESNLFLIQVCQEAEEALEESRSQQAATQQQLNSAAAALQSQIACLQASIEASAARTAALKAQAEGGHLAQSRLCLAAPGPAPGAGAGPGQGQGAPAGAGGAAGGTSGAAAQEVLVSLEELSRVVAATYQRCGFEPDASLSTLAMLTSIEVRLEESIAAAGALPAGQVGEAEKARERERRQRAREEKAAAAAAEHELRVQRALERAAAPVFRKAGKPVMARSQPPRRKVAVVARSDDAGEAELAAFLARDLL